ncbi:MAG: helix-turn-helix transcriptional regulator [Coriobacteriia bacterium]|nr:helix-turn-helix transcriptional regulator [Coriobacteriia bacterium]MBS5478419.1 helix-turn-helix transcriptional regulator [Coriobacteriia bacterium]
MAPRTLDDYVARQLQDPEFSAVWREGEGEYQAMRALVRAREEAGLSQRGLSELSGVPQKTISLIESAGTNTTVETLAKLARGMGRVLTIRFEPPSEAAEGPVSARGDLLPAEA